MTKYKNKIYNVIKNHNANINLNTYDKKLIHNILYRPVKTNIIKKYEIVEIQRIHDIDEYPLLYMLITHLPDNFKKTNNINDIRTFIALHRENNINFDAIHKFMLHYDTKDELYTIYHTIFNATGVRKLLHDTLYGSPFICVDVQQDIESTDLNYVLYKIGIHTIHIYCPKNKNMPDINKIATIINTVETLSNNKIPVKLIIIYSSVKKILQQNTNIICIDNINSGVYVQGIVICCFRSEEFYKVLIHELIHYYKFDFFVSDPFYNELNNLLIIPHIIGIDAINESYTETLTIIILIVMQYKETNFDKYFLDNLNNEIVFIMFQIAKIIVNYGGTSFNDLVSNKITIHQKTNFRSYFIIKLVLLCNIQKFLNCVNDTIYMNNERLLIYGNLINDSWNNFINDQHNCDIINYFIQYINNSNKNKWIIRTLRMSYKDYDTI